MSILMRDEIMLSLAVTLPCPLATLAIESCARDLRVERVSNPTRVHLKHVEALEAYSPADPLQPNKGSCETNNLIKQFLVRVALQPNKGSPET